MTETAEQFPDSPRAEFAPVSVLLSPLQGSSYEPHPTVGESLLVYEDDLFYPETQQALLDLIIQKTLGTEVVFAGIEGRDFLRDRKFIGAGSEAERDLSPDGFFATTRDYWQQLIEAREFGNNPFKYASRGWSKPAVVASHKDKLYIPNMQYSIGAARDLSLEALQAGNYDDYLEKLDADGRARTYTTYWKLRPNETLESAAHHVFYLMGREEYDFYIDKFGAIPSE